MWADIERFIEQPHLWPQSWGSAEDRHLQRMQSSWLRWIGRSSGRGEGKQREGLYPTQRRGPSPPDCSGPGRSAPCVPFLSACIALAVSCRAPECVAAGDECANPACDNLDDAWAGGEALLREHPDWPEVPEAGERYPL